MGWKERQEARRLAQGWTWNQRGYLEPPPDSSMRLSDAEFSEQLHRQDPHWKTEIYDDLATKARVEPGVYRLSMGYLAARQQGLGHEDAMRAGQIEAYGKEREDGVLGEAAYNRRMQFLPTASRLPGQELVLAPAEVPVAAAPVTQPEVASVPAAAPAPPAAAVTVIQPSLDMRGEKGRFLSVKGTPPAEAKRQYLAQILRSAGKSEDEVVSTVERLAPLELLRESGLESEGPLPLEMPWDARVQEAGGSPPQGPPPPGPGAGAPVEADPPAAPGGARSEEEVMAAEARRLRQVLAGGVGALLATYGISGLMEAGRGERSGYD